MLKADVATKTEEDGVREAEEGELNVCSYAVTISDCSEALRSP